MQPCESCLVSRSSVLHSECCVSSGIYAIAGCVKSDVQTASEIFAFCGFWLSHHFDSVVFQVLAINVFNAGEATETAHSSPGCGFKTHDLQIPMCGLWSTNVLVHKSQRVNPSSAWAGLTRLM